MDAFDANLASLPPEEEVFAHPWRLRRSAGGGRREIAAILSGGSADRHAAVAAIEAMRFWGQRPTFLVRAGDSALDAVLAEASLAAEAPTDLLAADAAAIAWHSPDVKVIDGDGPIAIFAELWAAADVDTARQAAMARVQGPRRYLLGRIGDRPAGAAFVSRHGSVAVVNALVVAPLARRRGLGRRILRWAAGWGAEQGAPTLALAVGADNAAAQALCGSVGLKRIGGYHYRVGTLR